MKVISPAMGTALVRTSFDDSGPKRGVLQRDLVEFIGSFYKFNIKPAISPGIPAAATPILQFQSGEFIADGSKVPIIQIIIAPDGHAVIAQDTDLADMIMTDYMAQLDKEFGYRFAETKLSRTYGSFLVAELNDAFIEKTQVFRAIEELLNRTMDMGNQPYKLKRLGFGIDTDSDAIVLTSIAQLRLPDFTIERRAGEPLERNRFFSRAPLTTSEHAKLLAEVERTVTG